MRNYRKKRSFKRKPTYRKAVGKAIRSVKDARISAVVKKVLGRQIETKMIQLDGTLNPVCLQSATASIASNNFCLTPVTGSFTNTNGCNIGNGVGMDQRIGDEIRIKSIKFDYAIFPLPYNATTNSEVRPMVVTIYVVRPKNGEIRGPFLNNYVSSTSAIFYESNSNAGSGMVGNLTDIVRRIDKENYEVLAVRQHKVFYSGVSGTGVPSTGVYGFNNNDFSFMARGSIRLSTPKIVKYDRVDEPKIQPIYAILQWQYADNTVAPSTRQALQWTVNNCIYFTDA